MKKTTFSITSYFDPYGDLKSTRKFFKREKFITSLSKEEVKSIIENYNSNADYYSEVTVTFGEHKKPGREFETSYYFKAKAGKTSYVDIPGY